MGGTRRAIELTAAAVRALGAAGAGGRDTAAAALEADLVVRARATVERRPTTVTPGRAATRTRWLEIVAGHRRAAAASSADVTCRRASAALEHATAAVARLAADQAERLARSGLTHLTHVGRAGAGAHEPIRAVTTAGQSATAAVRDGAALGARVHRRTGRRRCAARSCMTGIIARAGATLEHSAATVALLTAAGRATRRHADPAHVRGARSAAGLGALAAAAVERTAATVTHGAAVHPELLTGGGQAGAAPIVDTAFASRAAPALDALTRTAAVDPSAVGVLVLTLHGRERRQTLVLAAFEAAATIAAREHPTAAIGPRSALGAGRSARRGHAGPAHVRQWITSLTFLALSALDAAATSIRQGPAVARGATEGCASPTQARATVADLTRTTGPASDSGATSVHEQPTLKATPRTNVARRFATARVLAANRPSRAGAAQKDATAAITHRAALDALLLTSTWPTRARPARSVAVVDVEAPGPPGSRPAAGVRPSVTGREDLATAEP